MGNGAGFSGDRIDAAGPVVDTLIARGGARWRTTRRIRTQSYLVPRASVQPQVRVATAGEMA